MNDENKNYFIDIDKLFSLVFNNANDKPMSSNVITATYANDGSDSIELVSKEVTETNDNNHEYERFVMQTKYDFVMKMIDNPLEPLYRRTLINYGLIKVEK